MRTLPSVCTKEVKSYANSSSIPHRQPITPSRISRAQTHAGLLFNHDSFGIAEVTRLREFVSASKQNVLRVARQSIRFEHQLVRQPLMMDARRVDGLLNVHAVIDHVGDYDEHSVNNGRASGAADGEPEAAVFAQNKRRSHR